MHSGFDVITIFPSIITAYSGESILGRASGEGFIDISIYNLRDFTSDRHRSVDDSPYGGGAGMVFKIEPIHRALESIRKDGKPRMVILLGPQGRTFTQSVAKELAGDVRRKTLICCRYEGVDERVRESLIDDEISIGDYIITGGELAALVIIDAVARLIPGVLGDGESVREESFVGGLLEYPHYTRPPGFGAMSVPEVLLSGNHAEIARWRRKEALRRTLMKRPDLLENADLGKEDRQFLTEIRSSSAEQIQREAYCNEHHRRD